MEGYCHGNVNVDDMDVGLMYDDFVKFYKYIEFCRNTNINLGVDVYWVAIGSKVKYTYESEDIVIDIFLMDEIKNKIVYGGMLGQTSYIDRR